MTPNPSTAPDREFFCYQTGALPVGTNGLGSDEDPAGNVVYNRIMRSKDPLNPDVRRFPVCVDVVVPRTDYRLRIPSTYEEADGNRAMRLRRAMLFPLEVGTAGGGDMKRGATPGGAMAMINPTLPDLVAWRKAQRFSGIRDGKWLPKMVPFKHLKN